MLLLPFCKFPLPFLTLIEGQNVRQDAAGNGLNLMLWYGSVIDQFFLSAQRIPPSGLSASSYWSHCCCQSVGGFAPSTILLQIPLQNPTPPFLSIPGKSNESKHRECDHTPAKSPFSACCRSGDFFLLGVSQTLSCLLHQ